MEAGTGYYGHVAITAGAVRGRTPLDPALEIELKIQADGFAPGVAAMILASCHVRGARLQADLGQAETIITQLGFPPRDGGDTPCTTRVFARWRLTQAGVEHLERVRDGGNLAVYVTPEAVLLNHGESLPGLYPGRKASTGRTSTRTARYGTWGRSSWTSRPRPGRARSLPRGSRPPPSPSSSSSPREQPLTITAP
jgi:hypothetical protein